MTLDAHGKLAHKNCAAEKKCQTQIFTHSPHENSHVTTVFTPKGQQCLWYAGVSRWQSSGANNMFLLFVRPPNKCAGDNGSTMSTILNVMDDSCRFPMFFSFFTINICAHIDVRFKINKHIPAHWRSSRRESWGSTFPLPTVVTYSGRHSMPCRCKPKLPWYQRLPENAGDNSTFSECTSKKSSQWARYLKRAAFSLTPLRRP